MEFPINTENKIHFRWFYIALPAGFFLLSIILAAVFYPQLPAEISYRFNDSSADRVIALGAFVAITLIPQAFFTLMAVAVTRIVMLGARYAPPGETPLTQLLPIMGNMLALPQIILFFAMLQFFLYNAYQTGIIPLWIIAVIVLAAGGIILAVLFIRIIRRFRRRKA